MPKLLTEGRAYKPKLGGFPFKQFPAADDLTPESFINEQTRIGRQQIQDKYALQWKEVNRSKRFIGAAKSKRMLREIDVKAKQEMLAFNQKAEAQADQLDNINRLAEEGLIYNADELKARIVYGSGVAKSMYPPSKLPEQEWSALQVPLDKIEKRLAQFTRPKKKIPFKIAGVRQIWGKSGWAPGDIEVYDLSMINKDTGKMGVWRKATQQEIEERRMLLVEQNRIKRLQADILGRTDIQKRIVQPGTKGGTFGDKVTESINRPAKRHDPLGLFD